MKRKRTRKVTVVDQSRLNREVQITSALATAFVALYEQHCAHAVSVETVRLLMVHAAQGDLSQTALALAIHALKRTPNTTVEFRPFLALARLGTLLDLGDAVEVERLQRFARFPKDET